MKYRIIAIAITILFSIYVFGFSQNAMAYPVTGPVIVLGCDGLGSHYFDPPVDTPNLYENVISVGMFTMSARSIRQTVSMPNWAAHMLGSHPEINGIISNRWESASHFRFSTPPSWEVNAEFVNGPLRDKDTWPSVVGNGKGYFPSVFGTLKRHGYSTAAIMSWGRPIGTFLNPSDIDYIKITDNYDKLSGVFEDLAANGTFHPFGIPHFTFFHYGLVDHTGHGYGWGGPTYVAAVRNFDVWCCKIFDTLRRHHLLNSATIFIVSDHGGYDKGHGDSTYVEGHVPWGVKGPWISRPGSSLLGAVSNTDTSPTVLRYFGVQAPGVWTGRAIGALWDTEENEDMELPPVELIRRKYDVSNPTTVSVIAGCLTTLFIVVIILAVVRAITLAKKYALSVREGRSRRNSLTEI